MKNVLIIYAKSTGELLNRQSALGSYIFCLANLLAKNGYGVWINGKPLASLVQVNTTSNPTGKSTLIKKLIPGFVKQYKRDNDLFVSHKAILENFPSDVQFDVILEFYTYGSTLGMKLKNMYSCPYIVVFDSPVLEEYEFFHGKKYANKKKIFKRQNDSLIEANAVIVYSEPVKKYVSKITKRNDNISIHQNVDFTRFDFIVPRSVEGKVNIGFIGSFLKWHRVDLLINVFEKLASVDPNVELFLIGAGMEFDSIKLQVDRSPHRSRIELTGFCDGERLLEFKKRLHIGVMPGSNWYGAPNKIFEYGAAGLAVIAPDTPTISDIFTSTSGVLLFKQDDEKDFFNKLNLYIENHIMILKNAKYLQETIRKNYSESQTYDFYRKLIEEKYGRK